jgi:hypothetical protein
VVRKDDSPYFYIRYFVESGRQLILKEEATKTTNPKVAEALIWQRIVRTRSKNAPEKEFKDRFFCLTSERSTPTLEKQYDVYIKQISTRKRRPATKVTLAQIHCYWRKWIYPAIGQLEVPQVRNKQIKDLVAGLVEAGLPAFAIAVIVRCVKGIVASAIDENGEELCPVRWNTEFIGAPIVETKTKKQFPP